MERGKFANIGFAIPESHLQIKENPKASTRCDGQSLSFHLYQKRCELHLDKSCDINNWVYYVTRYCSTEVCLWHRFSFDKFYSYSFSSILLSANPISKMSCVLSIFLNLCVCLDPFDIGFRKKISSYPDYVSSSSDEIPYSRWHRFFHVGIV